MGAPQKVHTYGWLADNEITGFGRSGSWLVGMGVYRYALPAYQTDTPPLWNIDVQQPGTNHRGMTVKPEGGETGQDDEHEKRGISNALT